MLSASSKLIGRTLKILLGRFRGTHRFVDYRWVKRKSLAPLCSRIIGGNNRPNKSTSTLASRILNSIKLACNRRPIDKTEMTPSSPPPTSSRPQTTTPPPPAPCPTLLTLLAIFFLAALAIAAKFLLSTSSEVVPIDSPSTSSTAERSGNYLQTSRRRLKPPHRRHPPCHAADRRRRWQVAVGFADRVASRSTSPTYRPVHRLSSPFAPPNLLKLGDAAKFRHALGPLGQQAIETIEHVRPLPLSDIDRLLVGCQISSAGEWSITYVVHAATPISRETLRAKLPDATGKDHDGKKLRAREWHGLLSARAAAPNVLVAAPEDAIAGCHRPRRPIAAACGATLNASSPAPTPTARSQSSSPRIHSSQKAKTLFSGEASRLRDPLFWFLGDELSGAALSLNWDSNFFLELTASPTLDTPAEKASAHIRQTCD